MAGFSRYHDLLRLFTEAEPSWTVPAMSEALHIPASTIYRTVRELTAASFLEPSTAGSYRLGAAFIEYDRLLRLTDPLMQAGMPVLEEIVAQAGLSCVSLLARLHNGEVMCIADRTGPHTSFRSSYERGRPMPLTRGATSKAILASLPARMLGKLVGPRDKSSALRDELIEIRKAGFCFASSEIDSGLAGIAAPIALPERGIFASISLVVENAELDDARRRRLSLLTVSAASLLSESMTTMAVREDDNADTVAGAA